MAATKGRFMVRELRREREQSSLDVEELTNLIDSGEIVTARRREMFELMQQDPVFRQDDRYFHSREEALDRAMEKSVHYIQLLREEKIVTTLDRHMFKGAMSEDLPVGLHEGMFVPTIEGQGTEEQKAKWLPLAKDFRIIGTYAQTEMGHGTHLRGLETTATYDPASQEFVLKTPSLTATKWWPGTLGHTATHAVVLARLITKGQDHGMHPFIVQLRSLENHKPLRGVKVGDIGPKFGYFGMDNGFLQLRNVRIPRDHMLMRYSKVAPDGTYFKPQSDKITYGTMVMVRSGIVIFTARALARAITIATRYSVVRRQGQNTPGGPETQVIDYQAQQFKLFPLIASAYALILTGQYMLTMHVQRTAEISQGNLESLPELHATSAGLKAFSSQIASEGIETCRLACGGHGYSLSSGLPFLYVNYVCAITYEGENTVMFLQTARYLMKLFSQKLPSSKLPNNVAYLGANYPVHKSCPVRTAEQFRDPHIQLEAYRQRARRMVSMATATYQEALQSGIGHTNAWNSSNVDWVTAATAHCHYVVLKAFHEAVQQSGLGLNNNAAMQLLCALFAVFGIVQNAGEFMTYMSVEQVALAKRELYSLLKDVRREAVTLVDAFDFPDEVLNSVLGRYDGDVYTHLYNWALKAPRNKKAVHDVYHKHLKGLLTSKL